MQMVIKALVKSKTIMRTVMQTIIFLCASMLNLLAMSVILSRI